MKKLFLIFINIVVLTTVVTAVYHFYIDELDSKLVVDCDYEYVIDSNSVLLSCDVEDKDLIISEDYPLTIYLSDSTNSIIFEELLEDGLNDFEISQLEFNSLYSIKVEGFDFIKEIYTLTNYTELNFSTVSENFISPTYIFTENLITDTEYHFTIEVIDLGNCATSVDIFLYNSSNDILLTQNYTDFSNLDFSFSELNPNKDYEINIEINYVINDYDESNILMISKDFITLDTQVSPSAELSNVYNDNVNLSFNLTTDNNDATEVLYTVELIDLNSDLLYSETTSDTEITLDVNEISGNYYISIKASYLLNGSTFTDVELATYNIYSSELSNFFVLPSIAIVNTDLPLTNYDDYANYIFTFLNQGITEFTIICEFPIDCSELVTNDLYSHAPFTITDFVHAYNDINTISYSYTSEELNISVGREYTIEDITLVDQKVETILNLIITESMTDYEKILAVHDYVVNNTVYDSTCYDDITACDTDHIAIGVFIDELAVCEGYAHAIDIMLRSLQIPTFRISSTTHQWNAVYFDGGWYHLDATWDDPITNNGSNILDHTYFLITTDELMLEDSSLSHDYSTLFNDFME